jgi:hypothetical protein
MKGEWSGGKGSFPRKVDTNKYNSNYDVIFKKNQKNLYFLILIKTKAILVNFIQE